MSEDAVMREGEALLEHVTPTVEQGTGPVEPPAPPEALAGPISELDPERIKEMMARLEEFKKSGVLTESGSEAPDGAPKFDLSQFEVEPGLEHLYQRAALEDTPEGPKWIVMELQYLIQTGAWHMNNGGQPRGKDKFGRMQYHARGLDQVINEIVNGPEGMLTRQKGWKLSALIPGGVGQGIAVFERMARRALPDPKPIVRAEEQPLEETTDEELARLQDKAAAWTGEGAAPETAEALPSGVVEVADIQAAADAGLLDVKAVEQLTNEGGQ